MNNCCLSAQKNEAFCPICDSLLPLQSTTAKGNTLTDEDIVNQYLGEKSFIFTGKITEHHLYKCKKSSQECHFYFLTLVNSDGETLCINAIADKKSWTNLATGTIATIISSGTASIDARIPRPDKNIVLNKDLAQVVILHNVQNPFVEDSLLDEPFELPMNKGKLLARMIPSVAATGFIGSLIDPLLGGVGAIASIAISYIFFATKLEKANKQQYKIDSNNYDKLKELIFNLCKKPTIEPAGSQNLEPTLTDTTLSNVSDINPTQIGRNEDSINIQCDSKTTHNFTATPAPEDESEVDIKQAILTCSDNPSEYCKSTEVVSLQKTNVACTHKAKFIIQSCFGEVIAKSTEPFVIEKTTETHTSGTKSNGDSFHSISYENERSSDVNLNLMVTTPTGEVIHTSIPGKFQNGIDIGDWVSISTITKKIDAHAYDGNIYPDKYVLALTADVYNFSKQKDLTPKQSTKNLRFPAIRSALINSVGFSIMFSLLMLLAGLLGMSQLNGTKVLYDFIALGITPKSTSSMIAASIIPITCAFFSSSIIYRARNKREAERILNEAYYIKKSTEKFKPLFTQQLKGNVD